MYGYACGYERKRRKKRKERGAKIVHLDEIYIFFFLHTIAVYDSVKQERRCHDDDDDLDAGSTLVFDDVDVEIDEVSGSDDVEGDGDGCNTIACKSMGNGCGRALTFILSRNASTQCSILRICR